MGDVTISMGVRSLRSSISFSLVLHAALAIACYWLSQFSAQKSPERLTWIELEPVPLATAKKNLARENIKKREDTKHQVVQTETGQKVDDVDKNAFLGEQNQKVDRQTVSKNKTTIMGSPRKELKRLAQKALELEKSFATGGPLSMLGLPILPETRPTAEPREKEARDDTPQWAEMGSSPQDYVKGIAESERTALNTREYVFYGYFQRIRERLDRAWVPILRSKLITHYRTGRRLASEMEHSTKVLVTLNPRGEITRVQVVNESGTKDLDDAAISAFNQAGPFPNPPKGIVDKNGEIQIPWEFILRT